MLDDFFSNVSPEMAGIGLAVVIAGLAFFTGVIRQIAGMVALAIGCFAGWWVFANGQNFYWMQEFTGRYLFGVAVIAGGATYLLLRVLVQWFFSFAGVFGFFSKIFGKSAGKGVLGAVLSLVPSSFLVLVSAAVMKVGGSIDRLDATSGAIFAQEGSASPGQSLLHRASEWIEGSRLNEVLEEVDPICVDEIETLGRLVLLTQDAGAWASLQNDADAQRILYHPSVVSFARSAQSRGLLESKNKAAYFQDEELRALVADEEVHGLLHDVDIDAIIENALYEGERRKQYRRPF